MPIPGTTKVANLLSNVAAQAAGTALSPEECADIAALVPHEQVPAHPITEPVAPRMQRRHPTTSSCWSGSDQILCRTARHRVCMYSFWSELLSSALPTSRGRGLGSD